MLKHWQQEKNRFVFTQSQHSAFEYIHPVFILPLVFLSAFIASSSPDGGPQKNEF